MSYGIKAVYRNCSSRGERVLQEVTLGEILEKTRIEKNISKIQLCEGVCTITALTRYEQDIRVPDKFVIDCLLERLGKNSNRIEFIDTDEEFEMSMYRDQIEKKFFNQEFLEIEELLKEYEGKICHSSNLHQQYLFLKRGQLAAIRQKYKDTLELFHQALSCTKRSVIEEIGIEKKVLSDIEVETLYSLAEIYLKIGEKEKAVFLLLELKTYLENLEKDNGKRIKYFPKVLLELAQEEKENYNFGLAYSYLEKAEEILIQEYQICKLEKVLQLQLEILEKTGATGIDRDAEKKDQILALKLIDMTIKNGMITREGIELWENTANLQL